MHWEVDMNEVRFVTIFAVSIAGWIMIMWLTLSALEAAQQNDSAADKRPSPAVTTDAPAMPPGGADQHGAALAPCAMVSAARPCARTGGAA
jgi:hypothetical protein